MGATRGRLAGARGSGACAEEALLCGEPRRPLDAIGAGEAQICAERVAHRIHESGGAGGREAGFPPEAEYLDAAILVVDPRLDPADEPVAEEDRQHVVAPPTLLRLEEALPHELEVEEAHEQRGVP